MIAVLALSGCADYLAVDGQGHTTATPPAARLAVDPVKGDVCGAEAMKYLVGHNKSEAPPPINPALRRVTCSTCAVTMDFRPHRVNIIYDEKTGQITAVRCG